MSKIGLTDRQLKILSSIVANYIKNGEPISSGTVYAVLKLNVCASTIRSDMSYLVAKGFLRKIHSSSGSIPSESGYRVYVDSIVDKARFYRPKIKNYFFKTKDHSTHLKTLETEFFKEKLSDLLNLLSRATKCVVLLHTKNKSDLLVNKIKIVSIKGRLISLFVMFSDNIIKNKTFNLSFNLDEKELGFIEKILNVALFGLKLEEITSSLIHEIISKNSLISMPLAEILDGMYDIFKGLLKENYLFSNIPDGMFDDLSNMCELFSILNFMKSKDLVKRFLAKDTLSDDCITVSIGRDNANLGLSAFSIISSKRFKSNALSGGISIIGPVRMNYSTAISNLIYFSSFLDKFSSNYLDMSIWKWRS